MVWALMVTAVAAIGLVTAVCFVLRWDNVFIVAPMQFLGAFIATYAISSYMSPEEYERHLLWICLAISAALALFFATTRFFVGPLKRRSPDPHRGHEHTDEVHRIEGQYRNHHSSTWEHVMNADVFKGKWKEIKGSLRAQWGKLTDDDVDRINGNVEELSGRLQKRYGWEKERAKQEISDFGKTIH